MHLRSGKALNKMTKSSNTDVSMSSQSLQSSSQAHVTETSIPAMDASVPTALGATMAMSISTEMGVAAPTIAPTVTAQMTRPKMGTFVSPFTAGVPVSTSVPTSPRVINTQISYRDQPYGMPTSMMANFHNIPAFTEH
jgi:hypothetical protein